MDKKNLILILVLFLVLPLAGCKSSGSTNSSNSLAAISTATPSAPAGKAEEITHPKTPAIDLAAEVNMAGTARVSSSSTLIPCSKASVSLHRITQNSHLERGCTYTGAFEITASNVTFDCQGAKLIAKKGSLAKGITITTANDQNLENITVRNCYVRGYTNNLKFNRIKYKDLDPNHAYDHGFKNILVENSRFLHAQNSGIYIDGYIEGVTLREIEVAGSGSVGIYINAGARKNRVENSHIHSNGYEGTETGETIASWWFVDVKYDHAGREGIAIDGARENEIVSNKIENNAAGGIFFYKNCGEQYHGNRKAWWHRPWGANRNLIQDNEIENEKVGVWLASRQSQNQHFMDCSDPGYAKDTRFLVIPDFAQMNEIYRNTFKKVKDGIRVEDNDNRIEQNIFDSIRDSDVAIVVGTKYRTQKRNRPVENTFVRDNRAFFKGGETKGRKDVYQWIYGEKNTVFQNNTVEGREAKFEKGTPYPLDPFLFVKEYWVSFW